MAPKAKEQSADADADEQRDSNGKAPIDTDNKATVSQAATSEAETSNTASPKPASRTSWYSGTWRTKSSALTATAKESISVEQGITSEASEKSKQATEMAKRPGHNFSQSTRGSRKSIPLAAEPTKVHATSDSSSQSRPRLNSEEKLRAMDDSDESKPAIIDDEIAPTYAATPVTDDVKSIASTIKPHASAWLGGFWSRPDGYASDSEKMRESSKRRKLDDSSSVPVPSTPQQELERSPFEQITKAMPDALSTFSSNAMGTGRSWFGMWSSAQNQQQEAAKQDGTATPKEDSADAKVSEATAQEQLKNVDKHDHDERSRASGWAFWSYERPKDVATTPGGTQKQLGEIAVADTPSQSHPEAAQFNEQRRKGKKGDFPSTKRARTKMTEAVIVPEDATASHPLVVEDKSTTEAKEKRGKARRSEVPNIVAPVFAGMYPTAGNAGYVEKLARYLAQTLYIPGTAPPASGKHVLQKVGNFPKIKKAIAIGVHGFFPAPLLQRVLGPPTGTSIRFANYAAASIAEWCQQNQPDIKEPEIEKVALEGEGIISDRVNTLWKLLLNWLDHLRQADFVMVACHSQGVPVAIMLVAKLIQLGVLSSHAKIGVCAMAGINLGPFLEYRSRLFAGSALELFDFCDSKSKVSTSYFESVDICLRHGVRISYIGSLDDQLVSLESSLFTPLTHPYVHRATFIDGRLHSPSFLTHLVIFALKLRNLGISDHGLIREVSAPVAGSLMGGEGHSRIYDDPAVYRLAVDFALESTDVDIAQYNALTASSNDKEKAKEVAFKRRSSVSGFPTSTAAANSMRRGSMSAMGKLPGIGAIVAQYEPLVAGANSNPFYLPWAVRGMLEEEVVKRDMRDEVKQLVDEFDAWKPQSKVMKDVKWRLEGVKSML